ncbi:MAG: hypothetical protein DI567_11735, partial [Aliarcobacter butzleri]
ADPDRAGSQVAVRARIREHVVFRILHRLVEAHIVRRASGNLRLERVKVELLRAVAVRVAGRRDCRRDGHQRALLYPEGKRGRGEASRGRVGHRHNDRLYRLHLVRVGQRKFRAGRKGRTVEIVFHLHARYRGNELPVGAKVEHLVAVAARVVAKRIFWKRHRHYRIRVHPEFHRNRLEAALWRGYPYPDGLAVGRGVIVVEYRKRRVRRHCGLRVGLKLVVFEGIGVPWVKAGQHVRLPDADVREGRKAVGSGVVADLDRVRRYRLRRAVHDQAQLRERRALAAAGLLYPYPQDVWGVLREGRDKVAVYRPLREMVVLRVRLRLVVAHDQRRRAAGDLKVLVRKVEHGDTVVVVVAHLQWRRVEYYRRGNRVYRNAARKGCRARRRTARYRICQREGRRCRDGGRRIGKIARAVKGNAVGAPACPGKAYRGPRRSGEFKQRGPVRAHVGRAREGGRRKRLHGNRGTQVQRPCAGHGAARAYAKQCICRGRSKRAR